MPELQPTLDTEIETLEQAIDAEIKHTLRSEYIAIVQPLKDELEDKIEQNKIIKSENAAFIAALPPTTEELEKERKAKIASEIALQYPELSDEVQEIRMVLAEEFPDNIRAQEYNSKIEAILLEYPKV